MSQSGMSSVQQIVTILDQTMTMIVEKLSKAWRDITNRAEIQDIASRIRHEISATVIIAPGPA